MTKRNIIILISVVAVLSVIMLFGSPKLLPLLVPFVFAHCDTMSGPVIMNAKEALKTGNPNPVLMWVQKKDEAEIKKAFQKTLKVRKLSPEAQELADMYFFETLVRIHRAGEGASYDGIKPAGAEVEPGIEAADKAVETGKIDALAKEVSTAVAKGIKEHFNKVMERKKHINDSVEAGRKYVEAYVTFIHYVENIHKSVSGAGAHHEGMEKKEPEKTHKH